MTKAIDAAIRVAHATGTWQSAETLDSEYPIRAVLPWATKAGRVYNHHSSSIVSVF